MARHGLTERAWRFAWSSGKRRLGSASIRRVRRGSQQCEIRTIRLSRHLVMLNSDDEVRDTILHEIAHALAGLEHGHDAVWQAKCVQIGARPQRLAGEEVRVVPGRYAIVCRRCERELATRLRRMAPRRLARSYCRHCGRDSMGQLQQVETQAAAQATRRLASAAASASA